MFAWGLAGVLVCAGCGQTVGGDAGLESLFVSECPSGSAVEPVRDAVLLDWSGGVSRIYPDWGLPALDFAAFETPDGGTLADDEEAFMAAVQSHVAGLLCDFPIAVGVRNGEGPAEAPYSIVYVSQAASPHSARQIGEGEYDQCNEDHDDDAIIFGVEIEKLGGPLGFDEWVALFGNVIAHEIGHLVGFGHVPRDEADEGEHALYVELMLSGHTLDELLSDQRFMSDLSNCPADLAESKTVLEPPTITCHHSDD